jgi:hypothetical protein
VTATQINAPFAMPLLAWAQRLFDRWHARAYQLDDKLVVIVELASGEVGNLGWMG